MKEREVIVWGIGEEYLRNVNVIDREIIKGNIRLKYFVSKEKYFDKICGIEVVSPHLLSQAVKDDLYVVICSSKYYQDIRDEAIGLGFRKNQLIPVRVFNIPHFDFYRYIKLIEDPVSIIAMDCYGSMLYHYLNLPFMSPFILCNIEENSYMRLLEKFDYYINTRLELYEKADIGSGKCPKGYLGNLEDKVVVNFNHHVTFEDAKKDWERRLNRMQENMLVTMVVSDKANAERFDRLNFRNKAAFSAEQTELESVHFLKSYRWDDACMRRYKGYDFRGYVRTSICSGEYDVLKMLNGEDRFFIRE